MNIRGLSSKSDQFKYKLSHVNNLIYLYSPDITILTETHRSKQKFNSFTQYSCPHKSAGLIILIHNNSIKTNLIKTDINGRYILISITHKSRSIKLLAVYAPSTSSHKVPFWNSLPPSLTPQILVGDFNLPTTFSTEFPFYKLMKKWNLYDSSTSTNNFSPTFRNISRPDRLYLSKTGPYHMINTKIIETPSFLDHKVHLSILQLIIPPTPYWKLSDLFITSSSIRSFSSFISNLISSSYKINWFLLKPIIIRKLKEEQSSFNKIYYFKIINLKNNLEHPPLNSDPYQSKLKLFQHLQKFTQKKLLYYHLKLELDNDLPSPKLTSTLKSKSCQMFDIDHLDSIPNSPCYDPHLQSQIAQQFFQKIYNHHPTCLTCLADFFESKNCLSQSEAKNLLRPFSEEELFNAIDSSNLHSSPGKDGLSYRFYKKFKKELSPILLHTFNDLLLNSSPIPNSIKEGITVTVFKGKGNPNDLNNRRPITLLNTDYKLYTKLLNSRILSVIDKLISPLQQGFLPSRSILTNPLIIDHLLHQSSSSIAFIDFEKAFDSISHKSIIKALYAFNFPSKFIRAIKNILLNSTTSITINNFLSPPVYLKKGTKQGDPISPTLFILVIEFLSKFLSTQLQGINVNNLNLNHLLYADDLALILSDPSNLATAISIFDKFYCATGLKLNISKSVLFSKFSSIPKSLCIPLSNEFKYLGFDFTHSGIKEISSSSLTPLINLLEKWKISPMIKLKTIIFKTYAYSKLFHKLYLSPTSISFFKSLKNVLNWYIWISDPKYNPNKNYRSYMNLKRRVFPFSKGGINMFDFELRNTIQKATAFHKILTSNSLLSSLWIQYLNPQTLLKSSLHALSNLPPMFLDLLTSWRNSLNINILKNLNLNNFEEFLNSYSNSFPMKLSISKLYHEKLRSISPRLTPKQLELQKTHNFLFSNLFKSLTKLCLPLREKNILFRIFSSTLPKAPFNFFNCAFCNLPEHTSHLFFECPRLSHLPTILHKITNVLKIPSFEWNEHSFWFYLTHSFSEFHDHHHHIKFYLDLHKLIIATFAHIIWTDRCAKTHRPADYISTLNFNSIFDRLKFNLTLAINTYFTKALRKINNPLLTPTEFKIKLNMLKSSVYSHFNYSNIFSFKNKMFSLQV